MKVRMKKYSALACLLLAGCGGNKAFIKGEYDDPNRVELLDDRFNEADMQQMADTIIRSLAECPAIQDVKGKKPLVVVEGILNQTEEHIDTESLTDKIATALIKSGKVRFMNKRERNILHSESQYRVGGGSISGNQRQAKGRSSSPKDQARRVGANYILSGRLVDHVQEVGDDKLIYYKLTMDLTNIQEETKDCSEEKEIRKRYKKRSFRE